MMEIIQVGHGKFLRKFSITVSKSTKTYGLFPNFKTRVLGVQLRCLEYLTHDMMNLTWIL